MAKIMHIFRRKQMKLLLSLLTGLVIATAVLGIAQKSCYAADTGYYALDADDDNQPAPDPNAALVDKDHGE
jgi:hypothetical protein